ncbi:Methylated-DNA--protein-cysteine methyltransferase [Rosistilla ulvae]|uniref:methylated-DNA--[protein]-cysteine S-methyltransferase n=1 Tax=Rosistilla ulvae TaxID=1930277 RepID=A0A517LZ29_9BACT|nr:methylated-DNA--[protein]-cysteine S-methyltransferase [Rosistilla ulvae]QDS87883.1 Methylated-DNA--protein-cysteine methyltransferase [Rosistilla ulvae]
MKLLPIESAGLCKTPLGVLLHQWTAEGLFRVELFADATSPKIQAALNTPQPAATAEAGRFASRIDDYFAGNPTSFADIRIDPSGWTAFNTAVYRACREVPPGATISYKELARRAGRPAAARAVGQAMARNRIPIVIPCHRIVGSSGRLTGFSADGGIDTKRWLLDRESGRSLFEIDPSA